jgi:hypothetical protein
LGIATIWPTCWIFIFIALVFTITFFAKSHVEENGVGPIMALFYVLIGVHLLTVLGTLALIVYYIYHIFKNERLEQSYKIIWTIMLFFAGMLAMPIYWYMYIWRDAPQGAALGGPPGPDLYLNQPQPENWTSRQAEAREYVPPPQPPNWRE